MKLQEPGAICANIVQCTSPVSETQQQPWPTTTNAQIVQCSAESAASIVEPSPSIMLPAPATEQLEVEQKLINSDGKHVVTHTVARLTTLATFIRYECLHLYTYVTSFF